MESTEQKPTNWHVNCKLSKLLRFLNKSRKKIRKIGRRQMESSQGLHSNGVRKVIKCHIDIVAIETLCECTKIRKARARLRVRPECQPLTANKAHQAKYARKG